MYVFGWAGAYKERCGDRRDGRSYDKYNKATSANTATIGIGLSMGIIDSRAAGRSPIYAFHLNPFQIGSDCSFTTVSLFSTTKRRQFCIFFTICFWEG